MTDKNTMQAYADIYEELQAMMNECFEIEDNPESHPNILDQSLCDYDVSLVAGFDFFNDHACGIKFDQIDFVNGPEDVNPYEQVEWNLNHWINVSKALKTDSQDAMAGFNYYIISQQIDKLNKQIKNKHVYQYDLDLDTNVNLEILDTISLTDYAKVNDRIQAGTGLVFNRDTLTVTLAGQGANANPLIVANQTVVYLLTWLDQLSQVEHKNMANDTDTLMKHFKEGPYGDSFNSLDPSDYQD